MNKTVKFLLELLASAGEPLSGHTLLDDFGQNGFSFNQYYKALTDAFQAGLVIDTVEFHSGTGFKVYALSPAGRELVQA